MDNRPDWDTVFMTLAFVVAQRSPDSETKHGAVLVDGKRRILGTGFNGFPRGCRDEMLPNQRPGKYPFVIHAEVNALINSRQTERPELCTLYVTGEPCHECFKLIVQYGIGRVVYGGVGSNCIDANDNHNKVTQAISEGLPIKVERYDGSAGTINDLLTTTAAYVSERADAT